MTTGTINPSTPPQKSRPGWFVVIYCVVSVFAWALGANLMAASRQEALQALGQTVHSTTVLVAEQSRTVLGAADLGIRMLTRRLTTSDWQVLYAGDRVSGEQLVEVSAFIADMEHTLPLAGSYFVIDTKGDLRAWGKPPPIPQVNFADRSYFKTHTDDPSTDVRIGPIVSARLGEHPVFTVTRRIQRPDGSFGGVVGIAVDPAALATFFRSLHVGDGGMLMLMREDGSVLSRFANGQMTATTQAPPGLWRDTENSKDGTATFASPIDNVLRSYSWIRMPEMGLIAVAGMNVENALATWWRNLYATLFIAIGLHIILTFAVLKISRQIATVANANSQLLENDARLRIFFEAPFEGIIISRDGVIVDANTALERYSGHKVASLVGTTLLQHVHPDDRPLVIEALKAEETEPYEVRILHHNGEFIDVEVRGHVLPGQSSIRITALRDISARKSHERRLKTLISDLEQSNQDLEQFAYVASHDLQEPLRTVSSYVGLLARRYSDVLGSEGKEFVQYAVQGARRMQNLIHDLLDYSRVGSRGNELAPFDCATAVNSAVESLSAAIADAEAVVEAGPMPRIVGDRAQITRLFQNLTSNALKYRHPDEAPRIAISCQRAGDFWHFQVRDNGIGIAPEFAEQVFMIFQRLHGVGTYEGTGIGLAVARRIVDRHGGKIWIDTEYAQQGTIFHFTLPASADMPMARSASADPLKLAS